MRNLNTKLTGSLVTLLALSACGSLTGNKNSTSTSSLTSNATGGAVSISGFSPTTGVYNSVPSSVTINFSGSVLDQTTGSAVSSYSLTCGGNAIAASSVNFVAGLSSIAVSLPATSVAEGTVCTFTVSSSLRDGYGNYVTGSHSLNYQYSASGATIGSAGGNWVEAASPVYTSTIGNSVANSFQGVGASGSAMSGIMVNGSTYLDGISGLWSAGFTSTSPAAGPIQGNTSQSFTTLSCPTGYRMTGITGRSGSYIDSIAIICKTQDQSQTYTSASFGGGGGNAYTLSCPSGKFVTDLNGTSGSYLDALYLGCR
jgi:hypothetical protein